MKVTRADGLIMEGVKWCLHQENEENGVFLHFNFNNVCQKYTDGGKALGRVIGLSRGNSKDFVGVSHQ